MLVCSEDGLDEVSLSAATQVREVQGDQIRAHVWSPGDFGLPPCPRAELEAADAAASAALVCRALEDERSPAGRITIANAAAGLLVADRVKSLPEGVAQAGEAVRSGRAREVLDKLRRLQ